MEQIGYLIVLMVAFVAGVVVGVVVVTPAILDAWNQTHIEKPAHLASWRIHQQATRAFGQMLEAARKPEQEDQP